MKIALLGANGQLGSDLCKIIAETGKKNELIPFTRSDIDVLEPEVMSAKLLDINFDVLINCTSYHKTDEVENNATTGFAVNAHAVGKMAETCRKKQAVFLHISTDYVFSGKTQEPYRESNSIGPVNVYGASKAMGELLALDACTKTYILRVASLYGVAGASGKGGNFVETMLRLARQNGELRVVDDIIMSPTATYDLAKAMLALIERQPEPGIYHAVNSGSASWYQFAKEILTQAGVNARTIPLQSHEFPTVARRPSYSVLNNDKLTGVVGELRHWSEALKEYLKIKHS
jgi:dTDP-4-dehydrorhamnose reductase